MTHNSYPHNEDAERSTLGSILIDPSCIGNVSLILGEDDFYTARHKCIYAAMAELYRVGTPVDFGTLMDRIESNGKLKAAGGGEYVTQLLSAVPSSVNVTSYATIVREDAQRRRLIDAASIVAKVAHNTTLPLANVMAQAESAVYKVRSGQRNDRMMSINQVNVEVYDEFEAIERGEIPAAISTGYTDIDRYMTGLRRGELTIIASRPGIGKSALLFAMALLSAKAGHGTILFSAEMDRRQVIKRMIQSAGVENFPGGQGFEDRDWPKLFESMGEINDLPLWIDDTPCISDYDIRAKSLRMASMHDIKHIFVDYIQLLKSGRHNLKRYAELGSICSTLKELAREMYGHVAAAAQLGRAAEGIMPTLAHLKESGALEEYADNVWLVHRKRETPPPAKSFESWINIAKQRNGPTGIVKLGWYPSRVSFVPLAQEKEEQYGHYADNV